MNFLISYLGGAGTLSRNTGKTYDESKELMDSVFDSYPGLQVWQDKSIEFARKHGYTLTAYGNRRHLDKRLFDRDDGLRKRMERQGVNARVQSAAADILKVVLTQCHETGLFPRYDAHLFAPVYDELACFVPVSSVWAFIQELIPFMSLTPPGHQVPMVPEFSIGMNWGNVVELGADPSHQDVLQCLTTLGAIDLKEVS